MKINEIRPHLETSGELEEQFFSIQDQGMIFDILRNKMYSNPILAIAREISCNARDAHREVGTPEVPIQIHLPNYLEPEYRIRDFGPGISPDRMSNVFIKYTASTKRNDNVQTGGFGLGAKTPFSYSDSFSIVTYVNGTKYLYNCVIDETKVGKLMLASSEETAEHNGTEIIIPALNKNFNDFYACTEQACRHWDVKPDIVGGKIVWTPISKILEGKSWAITACNDYNRGAKVIIDGVEYPLALEALRKYADSKLIDAAQGDFVMYFGVGELSLSASRESIHLDEKTQKIIRDRMTTIQNEIKQNVMDKIQSLPNLWDANVYYRKELKKEFSNIVFLGKLTWNGTGLTEDYYSLGCPILTFTKGKYSRKTGNDPNKLSRYTDSALSFEEGVALYINDLPIKDPTPRHVKKAFDDDPLLKKLHVVCPTDKVTLASLEKAINIDKMAPKLLSSITKASARTYTPASSRLIIFKFDKGLAAFRQVSYASLEEDTTAQKVLCTLTKEQYPSNRIPYLKNKKQLSIQSIKTLISKFKDVAFYGVDESAPADRIEEDLSDFIDIEDFLNDNVLNNQTIDYLEIKFALSKNYHLDDKLLRIHDKMKKLITDPKSYYISRLDLHQKIKQIAAGNIGLLHIYESVNGVIDGKDVAQYLVDNPQYNIDSVNEKFDKKYPLLKHLQTYYYDEIVEYVAQYVNLIDKE